MKKIFPIIFLIFFIDCASSKIATQEEMNHEFVVEFASLTKDKIYEKCLKWIASNFVSAKQVIDLQDKEAGTIVAKGYKDGVDYGGIIKSNMGFQLTIDCKDNKARFRFLPLYIKTLDYESSFENKSNLHIGAHKEFIKMKDSLKSFIENSDDF